MDELSIRNSRKIYIYYYVAVLIMGAYYLTVKLAGDELKGPVLVGAGILILLGFKATEINRLNNIYTLSDDSIVHKRGLLKINSKRIFLKNISDVVLVQGVWNRVVDYGSIELFRFGEKSALTIRNINRPAEFAEEIRKRVISAELLGEESEGF